MRSAKRVRSAYLIQILNPHQSPKPQHRAGRLGRSLRTLSARQFR
jgi:hypothetical protein